MHFPVRKIPIFVDPKQISVVLKRSSPHLVTFPHFPFFTFPFSIFLLFCFIFPLFHCLSFPDRSAEISGSDVWGGHSAPALPPPPPVTPLFSSLPCSYIEKPSHVRKPISQPKWDFAKLNLKNTK